MQSPAPPGTVISAQHTRLPCNRHKGRCAGERYNKSTTRTRGSEGDSCRPTPIQAPPRSIAALAQHRSSHGARFARQEQARQIHARTRSTLFRRVHNGAEGRLLAGRLDGLRRALDGHGGVAGLLHFCRGGARPLALPAGVGVAEHPLQLLHVDCAAAVRIERVEEAVDGNLGRIQAEHRHRAPELGLGHLPVAVLVPLAEEVKHAHRVLDEVRAQLVDERHLGGLVHHELTADHGALLALLGLFLGLLLLLGRLLRLEP
mmetsp:Transcript_50848/g.134526  ORF Transcript_50848/g.134526 Transcript_50848/m.134526 type:complete len:260 (-) Transcript_50848:184-963(-)